LFTNGLLLVAEIYMHISRQLVKCQSITKFRRGIDNGKQRKELHRLQLSRENLMRMVIFELGLEIKSDSVVYWKKQGHREKIGFVTILLDCFLTVSPQTNC
jgi:hypothetical protein